MSQRIVNRLEAIQVEITDRQHFVAAVSPAEGLLQAVRKQDAVGQLGERVMIGRMLEMILLLFQLGNVREQAHVVADLMVFPVHAEDIQPGGVDLAVGMLIGDFTAPAVYFSIP